MEPITEVIYRIFQGEVLALFPGVPGTREVHTCASYAHMGQHSSADLAYVMASSKPAMPNDYAALHRELEGRGYRLKIVGRTGRKHREQRTTAGAIA